mgnify:CR=1 FL=1
MSHSKRFIVPRVHSDVVGLRSHKEQDELVGQGNSDSLHTRCFTMTPCAFFFYAVLLTSFFSPIIRAHPNAVRNNRSDHNALEPRAAAPPNCFPAVGFKMPTFTPSSVSGWWCDYKTEYAFVGFSYEITSCECRSKCH